MLERDRDMCKEKADRPELEKCVLCKKTLDIPKDRNVSERTEYIRGIGQLCCDCYAEVCAEADKRWVES